MGKRDRSKSNIENRTPVNRRQQSCNTKDTNHGCDTMKTRSGRDPNVDYKQKELSTNPADFPAAALMQNIASSVSAETTSKESDIAITTTAGNRSPLTSSAFNEQTPEKSTQHETVICLVPVETDATPTTNLKILCDAANESFSPAEITLDNSCRVRAEPVTPTANLKMLITAASPEIRSLELSKSRLFEDDEDEDIEGEDDMDDEDGEERQKKKSGKAPQMARKAKSLGILCRR